LDWSWKITALASLFTRPQLILSSGGYMKQLVYQAKSQAGDMNPFGKSWMLLVA
jgi:hypothetical protein